MRLFGRVKWGSLWTGALRLGGLFVIVHEALSPNPVERPVLYIAALAMMGISITVPVDRKRQGRDE